MMRWGAALAAGILLLGGVALWWMVSAEDPGNDGGPAIVPELAAPRWGGSQRRAARPIPTAPLPSEEELEDHPASGRWLLLRDEETGRPLVGATVEALDAGVFEQSDSAQELREHLSTFEPGSTGEPRWSWRSLVSDRRGLVRLPAFLDTLWLRHRGDVRRVLLWSVDAHDWPRAVRPLETERGRWLGVVARRADATPVPHALLMLAGERGRGNSGSVAERFLVTDATGAGRFWLPEALWGRARLGWLGSGLDDDLARSIDGETAELTLNLPPSGAVEISFIDGDGAAFEGPVLFDLEVEAEGGVKSTSGVPNLYAEGGPSVVGGLPIRSRFRVRAESVDSAFESEPVVFAGPSREGETVRVAITIWQLWPLVRGQIRDTGGRPAARSRIALELQSPPPGPNGDVEGTWYQELIVITDGSGRFSGLLLGDEPPPGATWVRATQLEDPVRRLERQGPRCEVLRGPLLRGINDLGTLTLVEQSVIVAGRVVDGEGRPIEGARIFPAVQHPATAEEEAWWEFRNDRKVRSRRDGGFAIFDDRMRGSCRLDVEKPGYLWNRTAPFPTGADDLEVTLVRGGWLSCRLLLDEGLRKEDVQAVILGAPARNVSGIPGEPAENEMMPGLRSHGDLFQWRGVNAGVATLSVRAWHAQGPELHRVGGIEVHLGEGTEDPRLHPLDLRGRIPVHVVALSDEDGPGLGAPARIMFVGDPGRVVFVGPGVKETRLIILGNHTHVAIQARSYASWAGPVGAKLTRVRMERAAATVLRIQLPAPLEIPEGAVLQVEARLVMDGLPPGSQGFGMVERGRPDAGGWVRLDLPHAGRYSLVLRLWSRVDPASWYPLDLGVIPDATIPRGTADHIHALDVDPRLLNLRMRQLIAGR